jgi:multiple RNA-binding domain-containing protein 1
MAVRLAIGEVQVVTENREFLAQHGVDIDALESNHSSNRAVARSTTTLLIKNLPATTVPDEIESMFARYGSIAGNKSILLFLFCFLIFCYCCSS